MDSGKNTTLSIVAFAFACLSVFAFSFVIKHFDVSIDTAAESSVWFASSFVVVVFLQFFAINLLRLANFVPTVILVVSVSALPILKEFYALAIISIEPDKIMFIALILAIASKIGLEKINNR